MDDADFKIVRAKLNKTQSKLAQLLGVSVKAIHSYEQGWRKIPHHVERQLLFLLSRAGMEKQTENCWDLLNCQDETCPAREFDSGELCWFVNGTLCSGKPHKTWAEKMETCRTCEVFRSIFDDK